MALQIPQNAALILVDVQKAWDDPVWGRRNNPQAEENIATLLHAWRETRRPVFIIQHLSRIPNSPLRPGAPGCELKDIVRPLDGEPVLQKQVHSSFIGTDLEERLRRADITAVFTAGFMTNHCVETTTRMASDLGFHAHLVSDAAATFDRKGPDGALHTAEEIHAMTLTNLYQDFATIVTTEEVLSGLS